MGYCVCLQKSSVLFAISLVTLVQIGNGIAFSVAYRPPESLRGILASTDLQNIIRRSMRTEYMKNVYLRLQVNINLLSRIFSQ